MNSDTLIICSNENTAAFARLTFGCDAAAVDHPVDFGHTKWQQIVVAVTLMMDDDESGWIRNLALNNLRPGGDMVWL